MAVVMDYPILPDTAPSLRPSYLVRPVHWSDAPYMEAAQGAAQVLRHGVVFQHGVTLCVGNLPLCAWGITPLWTGVGVIWLFRQSAEAMAAHALPVARTMRRVWAAWMSGHPYRWVECLIREDDRLMHRLLPWLGFQWCCTKWHYGTDGTDCALFAWWEWEKEA